MMLGEFCVAMVLGGLGSLGAGALLLPVLRKVRAGQTISKWLAEEHGAKQGIPTLGGLFILAGLVVSVLFMPPAAPDLPAVAAVLCATLGFGLVGFIDDVLIIRRGKNLGLRAREKLLGQFLVAALFTAWVHLAEPSGDAFREFGVPLLWVAYQVLLLVGFSNAVNLTDGLDGLAAGATLPLWLSLGILGVAGASAGSWLPEVGGAVSPGLVRFAGGFAGATLGYLWFNAHPARVFMGDTGSLAIGGGLAALAILIHRECLLLLMGAIPVLETASVTVQVASFKLTGRRVFKMAPVHHHFTRSGMPETTVVAQMCVVSGLASALALATVLR